MEVTPAMSENWNKIIERLADEYADTSPPVMQLAGSGKVVPYYGWFWRRVDFCHPVDVGLPPEHKGFDTPTWVGFMESNKWGYDSRQLTSAEMLGLQACLYSLQMADEIFHEAGEDSFRRCALQQLFDFMQTLDTRGRRAAASV